MHMLHVHMMIHILNLLLVIGVVIICFCKNNKQCRTKGVSPISTPTMLFYMNSPEPNDRRKFRSQTSDNMDR